MVYSAEAIDNLREMVRGWMRVHGRAGSVAEAEEMAEEMRAVCGQVAWEESLEALSGRATYRGSSTACRCGGRARFVSYRRRWLKTLAGEASLERAYYHCSSCHRGVSPWDREQGLNGLVWTPRVKALVSQASARLPYGEAVELLEEAGVIRLEESSAEEIVAEVGSRLRAEEAREEETVRHEAEERLACRLLLTDEDAPRSSLADVRAVSGDRLYVSLDAAKAHIDGEWHDVKVGAIYTVRPDEEGFDQVFQRTYVAGQRSSDRFGWQLRTRALTWNQPVYKETAVVADGAEYNWTLADTHFPGATQVLDFWHASEHIWELSRALYRQDDPKETAVGERWARERVGSLKEEGPLPLLRALKRRMPRSPAAQQALRRERAYFAKNRARMDYPGFRKRGMMIGSGPVEAACKVVVGQRMKQAGMRWTSRGADNLLAIRTAVLSKERDRIQRLARAA